MPPVTPPPSLFAAAESVRQAVTSRLVDGFSEWWEMPAAVAAAALLAAFAVGMIRRDAAEMTRPGRWLLAGLRLATLGAVAVALLDFERVAEHEIVSPSRVAVLVDSSASMTLDDGAEAGADVATVSRADRGRSLLGEGGLLEALAARHEVSLWRFDADAERLAVLPRGAPVALTGTAGLAPRGYETRLGEALETVVDQEPAGVLAGVVVLTDGGNNAGLDPSAAAARLAAAGVAVHSLGLGSDRLPANVRVADLIVPARVFPGDRFAVTAYLQAHGLAGQTVRVELSEGHAAPGRRTLAVRLVPPPADRTPGDDVQEAEIEVVDRVTQVLLLAGGPSREYQFMRNVLVRDKSFAVDVLLATASNGVSQDARRILDAFPATDEALAAYDAIVAFDYDWRLLDPAAVARLDRWVARESGGALLFAGNLFMDAWPGAAHTAPIRGLYPVELRRGPRLSAADGGGREPAPLVFTREGRDAEFLWLAGNRVANQTVWAEFPGVHACHDAGGAKPGATVYAHLDRPGPAAQRPVYLVGQFYGSGSVLYVGSGELWRLRAVDEAVYERLATQLVRHVAQGRLLRGRRARLLVDRDRFPVGATVTVRVLLADPQAATNVACRTVGPDGGQTPLALVPEPGRPGALQAGFVAAREGAWQIELDAAGDETLARRIQVQLPDRELARPNLDRGLLEQIAGATGGGALFPARSWTADDATRLAAAIPDRSRREYETGAADVDFKRRLNAALLAVGIGCLCLEWVVRRLAKLA
ncbi:MAG: hypothetical protein ACKONH_05500 [Planctomycetia bacterium]